MLDTDSSGFVFRNDLIENDTFNVLDFTNFYTGSGVGIADFNQDGLPDIFMGANMKSSALYLNKGELKFEDISEKAGIKTDRWITGVSITDINQDGLPDIYLSVSGFNLPFISRKNMLFIHKGIIDGIPQFRESAKEYNLDVEKQVTQTYFFDYDKDGDDDIFMIVNPTDYALTSVNNIRPIRKNGEAESTDILFRNEGNNKFVDVSNEAGILIEGYSLGGSILDINQDGWLDVFVCNDFLSNDLLYINQKDGTFKNELATYFDHTGFASMGVDVADINQDNVPDIMSLDMLPEDHYRYNKIVAGFNLERTRYILKEGYSPQYSRNIFQLSQSVGEYAEVGQFSGVAKTDWSWSILFQDYDNDTKDDIHVTNGFGRDMGDLDYINYMNQINFGTKESIRKKQLKSIHELKPAAIHNYLFIQDKDYTFKKNEAYMAQLPLTCGTGAAYSDLDNDGDLDMIVNNVNDFSHILINETTGKNFIQFKLIDSNSIIGSRIKIQTKNQTFTKTLQPFRGYLSSVDQRIHFGLDTIQSIINVEVTWPDGITTVYEDLEINVSHDIVKQSGIKRPLVLKQNTKIPLYEGLELTHQEDEYTDFSSQSLLPFGFSRNGPVLLVADIDRNGKDDIVLGSSFGYKTQIGLQSTNGSFNYIELEGSELYEDTEIQFKDFDGDNTKELLILSGGSNFRSPQISFSNRMYKWNIEKEEFQQKEVPWISINTPHSSMISVPKKSNEDQLIMLFSTHNDQDFTKIPLVRVLEKNTNNEFVDQENGIKQAINGLGRIADAKYINQTREILLVGPWMPITFVSIDAPYTVRKIKNTEGWWNSINEVDYNKDGITDYVLGNFGANHPYSLSPQQPLRMYEYSVGNTDIRIPVLTKMENNRELPLATRDMLFSKLPHLKKIATTYEEYAKAEISDLFKREELDTMKMEKCVTLQNAVLIHTKEGFTYSTLPSEFQYGPLRCAAQLEDYGVTIFTGNLSEIDPFIGPSFGFKPKMINESSSYFLNEFIEGLDGEISSIQSIEINDEPHIVFGVCDKEIVTVPTNKLIQSALKYQN